MANANTQFGGFLTNVGVVKQTNANALQTPWKITRMQLGDAGGEPALFPDPTPAPTQTALLKVVYDAPLNSLAPSPSDPGVLIAELVLPPNVGGWWIRETALLDEDGDLIAVASPAPSYKPLLVQNSGRTQTIRMHVVVGNTANIQLKIDPSVVLATRALVEAGDAAAREYAASLGLAHLAAADPHPQYRLRGAITSLNSNAALTAAHEGVVLIDATAGARTITLPASTAALGVRDYLLRRTDITSNQLTIAAAGGDKIMLDTSATALGQATTELIFGGDWLHLRSDGAGKWWCIGQAQLPGGLDSGLIVFSASGVETFAVPPVLRSGRRQPRVKVIGGGGGGRSSASMAGGGGGGGVAEGVISLAGIASVPVTVGAGAPGDSGGTGKGEGGASSFGTYMSATGGIAGTSYGLGGPGGVGSGGQINSSLGPGGWGAMSNFDGGQNIVRGGSGGGPGGIGGCTTRDSNVTGFGTPGTWPGGGGGGGDGTATGGGGRGADGGVIIQW